MKLGIVMEGGASRTIFSCGVTDVFIEADLYPDYFVGVSAGIAYGVSYLSKQKGRNAYITKKYMHDKRYMGMRYLIDPTRRCYYNLDFAFGKIPNRLVPFDYEALANFPGKIEAVVTNIETGDAEYMDIPRFETDWKTTIASCALPLLFQPIKIGDGYYIDGGVADSIPYKRAFEEGCDKVIVILTRERNYIKHDEGALRLLCRAYRKFPKVVERLINRADAYNRISDELAELEKQGKIFVIAPEDTFGVRRTERSWEKLGPLYKEGVRTAKQQMEEIYRYLES